MPRAPVERFRWQAAADQEAPQALLAWVQVQDVAFGYEKLRWLDNAADK